MKLNKLLFVLAAAALFATGARAQDQSAQGSDQTQAAPATAPVDQTQAQPMQKKDWKDAVKGACSAEVADGGVCAGKDFGAGLGKCLDHHRHKLSKDCRKAVRRHHRRWMHKHHAAKHHHGDAAAQPAAAPDAAPAAAPDAAPAANPGQ